MAITYDANGIYVDNQADVTIEQILAAVTAAEVVRVDSGTGFPTYRFKKTLFPGYSSAGIQSSNPTSLTDSNRVLTFDSGKTFQCRGTNTSNLALNFGTKIGSGNEAGGCDGVDFYFKTASPVIRGVFKLYGCRFKQAPASTGVISFISSATGDGSEILGGSIEGFATTAFGSATSSVGNIFETRMVSGSGSSFVSSHYVANAKRVTILCRPTAFRFFTSAASNLSFPDYLMLGSASISVVNSTTGQYWLFFRPTWPQGVTRFVDGVGNPVAQEYWGFGVKVFWPTGLPAQGIPVRLTDLQGTLQVDAVTDANGEITWGAGALKDMVRVLDHVATPIYHLQHRSPMTLEINKGTGRVEGYKSFTDVFRWAGYESMTLTTGQLKDLYIAYQLSEGVDPQPNTNWLELEAPA